MAAGDLGAVRPISAVGLDWETAYAKTYKIQVSDDGVAFRDATPVLNGPLAANAQPGGHNYQTASLDASGRFVRVLGLTRATGYGFSLWDVNVAYYSNLAGHCDQPDAARYKAVTASSVQNASTPAVAAFDGLLGTRWSSAFSDAQWLQVDLGATMSVCRVRLNWEAAYAKTFVIQGSSDGVTFTDISQVSSGYDGLQSVYVSGSWRYVRMVGLTRATSYGYSLWEMSVVTDSFEPPPPLPTGQDELGPGVQSKSPLA